MAILNDEALQAIMSMPKQGDPGLGMRILSQVANAQAPIQQRVPQEVPAQYSKKQEYYAPEVIEEAAPKQEPQAPIYPEDVPVGQPAPTALNMNDIRQGVQSGGLAPVTPIPQEKPLSSASWGDFTNRAVAIAKEKGYPPGVLLAQAAIETARGKSNFAKNRNNYFGYQAYDSNPDAAKRYSSVDDSINDYINLITTSPRYSKAWAEYKKTKDPNVLIRGIKAAGYATDPNYVSKVISTPEFRNY